MKNKITVIFSSRKKSDDNFEFMLLHLIKGIFQRYRIVKT